MRQHEADTRPWPAAKNLGSAARWPIPSSVRRIGQFAGRAHPPAPSHQNEVRLGQCRYFASISKACVSSSVAMSRVAGSPPMRERGRRRSVSRAPRSARTSPRPPRAVADLCAYGLGFAHELQDSPIVDRGSREAARGLEPQIGFRLNFCVRGCREASDGTQRLCRNKHASGVAEPRRGLHAGPAEVGNRLVP